MRFQKSFARAIFFVFLLACLLTGLAGVVRVPVSAAPQMQTALPGDVVISEFRFRGPAGASDEFIELYNTTGGTINLNGWKVKGSNSSGSISTRYTFTIDVFLNPGEHYLLGNIALVNGIAVDVQYSTEITSDGGAAITLANDLIIDQVGLSATSAFKEGTSLTSFTTDMDKSYERKFGGLSGSCEDTNNNSADFLVLTPSMPQNSLTAAIYCPGLETFTPTDIPVDTDTPIPATAVPPQAILINEVAWGGTLASSSDEWFELYNNSGTDINLSGWRLLADDGNPDIPLSGIILAGDYFLVARYSAVFNDLIPDLTYSSGSFSNSGETLYLLGPNGSQVDTANINGGDWPAGSGSPNYASMERLGVVPDDAFGWATYSDTVAVAHDRTGNDIKGTPGQANWITTVTITPSPTSIPTRTPTVTRTPSKTRTPTPIRTATRTPTNLPPPPPPPLIAINEFVPRPGHDWNNDGAINTGDEYIELLNHGSVSVNLSGYRLDDEANVGSSPYSLPPITLKPGERMVFYGSQTGLLLSDGGDGVRLIKPNGQLMDAYNYFIVEFPDQSYCRLPDDGGADDWNTNCYPTPGLKNSLSGVILRPPTQDDENEPLCPIADTLPEEFLLAECSAFGNNIWNRFHWDEFGWYGEKSLPNVDDKWEVFAE